LWLPVFTYTYDGASRFITRLDAPNGLYTEKTWDGLDRLASVVNARPNATISSFAVTTDDADRRTRIDLADGGRWEFSYDNAGQLTGGTRRTVSRFLSKNHGLRGPCSGVDRHRKARLFTPAQDIDGEGKNASRRPPEALKSILQMGGGSNF